MTEYHRWAPDWAQRDDLPCQQVPEWWEPEGWADSAVKVRRARRGCATCPVRPDCLKWALTSTYTLVLPDWSVHNHPVRDSRSVLAGTTPTERRAVAHLPLDEQLEILSAQFVHHVTQGPFASLRESEVA
jgi:hypothetical protein